MKATFAYLIAAAAVLVLASLSWGESGFAPADLVALVRGDDVATIVVGELRAPRAAMAVLAGAALAVAGAILQAVMRNPLAEPGLLGINGGASLAVTLLVVRSSGPIGHLLPPAGFAGAVLAAITIHALAWRGGTSSIRLILVGIGVGAFTGAGAAFLTATGDTRDVQRALAWTVGSLYGADWARAMQLTLWSMPALMMAWLAARQLDVLGFDDDLGRSLGMRVHGARSVAILLATLLSGVVVATAGPLSFIGLVAPHLARRSAPARHAVLLPVAALWGALLLLAADFAGRLLQLPAGLLVPLFGVPFIGFLLWTRRHD